MVGKILGGYAYLTKVGLTEIVFIESERNSTVIIRLSLFGTLLFDESLNVCLI